MIPTSREVIMNIATVFDLLTTPESHRLVHKPCLKSHMVSPISPSISAFGTRAATESTTIITHSLPQEPQLFRVVHQYQFAHDKIVDIDLQIHTGSSVCSASINAASLSFCASATIRRATVVLLMIQVRIFL